MVEATNFRLSERHGKMKMLMDELKESGNLMRQEVKWLVMLGRPSQAFYCLVSFGRLRLSFVVSFFLFLWEIVDPN